MMQDKADIWDGIVARHDLLPLSYADFAGNSWQFADGMFGYGASRPNIALMSTVKIRQAGFHACIDSEAMFEQWIGRLQANRILPR